MGKKRRSTGTPREQQPSADNKPATLQDLLNPAIVNKLKAQANEQKAVQAQKAEQQRQAEEQKRKAEQKKRENDFEYLLNNSKQSFNKYQ